VTASRIGLLFSPCKILLFYCCQLPYPPILP
jgi:hypothetical protein